MHKVPNHTAEEVLAWYVLSRYLLAAREAQKHLALNIYQRPYLIGSTIGSQKHWG